MATINPSIFRAYDIRGTADPTEHKPSPDLTEESAYLIGLGTGTYLSRKYSCKKMIVGRDNRLHSEKLQNAFIKGVLETGLDVQEAGQTTSPMVYFASCFYETDCAVNVSASHNPKHDNGFKIVGKNAHSVADVELQEILKIIQTDDFQKPAAPGQLTKLTTLPQDYQNKIVGVTKLGDAKRDTQNTRRPIKVVIDAGNGIAGAYAPAIFRAMKFEDGSPACEVIELYCELDGSFPNHEANPEHAKNMVDLGRKVVETGADLGIGFDGDGDRVGVVDEKGKHYSAEYIIMLLARELLKAMPGEKIIHDVKVCQSLIDDILAYKGVPVMSRVGHSYIERRLASEDATFAGEKSGHLFFGRRFFNFYGFDDGIFAAAKILEALSKTTETVSQIFSAIPEKPNIPELKIFCPDEHKHQVIESVKEHFVKDFDCITLDGVRMQFPDGAWILARYSNTSPYLTLHAEAPTEARLAEIKELVIDQLRQHQEVQLP